MTMKTLKITVPELILIVFLSNILMKMMHANGSQLASKLLENVF